MKRVLFIFSVIAVFGAGIILLTAQKGITDEQKRKIAEITKDVNLAPDFTLTDVTTDSSITLSNLKGKVVLLNFWATWCYPCRLEIPDFNELHHKYSDKGLEILGVSVSDAKKSLENFMKSFRVDYPILYGSQNELAKTTMQYGGINAVPTTFIISRNGEVLRSYPGALIKGQPAYNDFIRILETELNKKTG